MTDYFVTGMKHLPLCDDTEKDTVIEDAKMMCEIIKYEDGLVSPEPRLTTASEDSPVFFSPGEELECSD